MKKNLLISGYIIYFIGVIFAACFATPKPPMWIPFCISLIVIITGAILIRKSYIPEPKKDISEVKEDRGEIQENLEKIFNITSNLLSNIKEKEDKIYINNLKEEIDKLLTGPVLTFADKRQYMSNVLGLESFAEIFGSFANGERSLNRAWSALSDGDKNECQLSLESAYYYFEEAYNSIKRITKKKGTGSLI